MIKFKQYIPIEVPIHASTKGGACPVFLAEKQPPRYFSKETNHCLILNWCGNMSSLYSRSSTLYTTSRTCSSEVSLQAFPQTFGFYKARHTDFHITLSYPLYYAYTYNGFRSKPDITLHPGHNKASPAIASTQSNAVQVHPITVGSTTYDAAPTEKLQRKDFFHLIHYFCLYLPACGTKEMFEWKCSSGLEVRMLGHSTGTKLIRVTTGEMAAVYANVSISVKKRGKMRWIWHSNFS
jgi:hypothetical protein